MKKAQLHVKPRMISIVVDNDSWSLPYAESFFIYNEQKYILKTFKELQT